MIKRILLLIIFSPYVLCLDAQIFYSPEVLIEETGGNSLSFIFLAGDLNNDSLPDLVGQGQENNSKFFFNNGDNTFEEQSFDVGNSFTPISIEDFNQDGLPDVLGSNRRIATNEGNNTFGYISDVSSSPNLDSKRVGAADFNNDGIMDYLSIPSVSFEDYLYWHEGNGNFEFTPNEAETSEEHEFASIVDFNQDGFPDIVSANQFGKGQFKLMLNDGEGNFELYRDLRNIQVSETYSFAGMSDLDQDGDMEIIGVSQNSGVYFIDNLGNDEFSESPTFLDFSYSGGDPLVVLVEDINNDGYPDVISFDENDSEYVVYMYENDKNGGFAKGEVIMELENYSGVFPFNNQFGRRMIQLIDMDGNASLDLVINDTKNGRIYLATNSTIVLSVIEKGGVDLGIYPNPTDRYITLSNDVSYDEYNIVGIDGTLVKRGGLNSKIFVGDLLAGQYVLILNQNGKPIANKTFVKQ